MALRRSAPYPAKLQNDRRFWVPARGPRAELARRRRSSGNRVMTGSCRYRGSCDTRGRLGASRRRALSPESSEPASGERIATSPGPVSHPDWGLPRPAGNPEQARLAGLLPGVLSRAQSSAEEIESGLRVSRAKSSVGPLSVETGFWLS